MGCKASNIIGAIKKKINKKRETTVDTTKDEKVEKKTNTKVCTTVSTGIVTKLIGLVSPIPHSNKKSALTQQREREKKKRENLQIESTVYLIMSVVI
jgi:hypothetical protein